MSLIGTLNVGKSLWRCSRRRSRSPATTSPTPATPTTRGRSPTSRRRPDQQLRPGMFIGTGVDLTGIQRQIDEALERPPPRQHQRQPGRRHDAAVARAGRVGLQRAVATTTSRRRLSTFFNAGRTWRTSRRTSACGRSCCRTASRSPTGSRLCGSQLASLQIGRRRPPDRRWSNDADAARAADRRPERADRQRRGRQRAATAQRPARPARRGAQAALAARRRQDRPQDKGVVNVYVGSEPLVHRHDQPRRGLRTDDRRRQGRLTPSVIFKANNGDDERHRRAARRAGQASRSRSATSIDKVDDAGRQPDLRAEQDPRVAARGWRVQPASRRTQRRDRPDGRAERPDEPA